MHQALVNLAHNDTNQMAYRRAENDLGFDVLILVTRVRRRTNAGVAQGTDAALASLYGIEPSAAARLFIRPGHHLVPTKAQFALWNGTVLIDASLSKVRHRLSRAGNWKTKRP